MFSSLGGIARRIERFSSSYGMQGLIHLVGVLARTFMVHCMADIAYVMNNGIENIIL